MHVVHARISGDVRLRDNKGTPNLLEDDLPLAFELAAYVTPIWHGVELCRQLSVGVFGPTTVVHVAALTALALVVSGPLAGAVGGARSAAPAAVPPRTSVRSCVVASPVRVHLQLLPFERQRGG